MSSLENPVLVLNRLWQLVRVCGIKRVLGMLFLGRAQSFTPMRLRATVRTIWNPGWFFRGPTADYM